MKYIDAENLIAEIEFAKSVYDNPKRVIHGVADAFRQDGRAAMCDDILKKIASLQQEQPEVDLEKVVEFECIGKKVKMTIQELVNYYIDSECCNVADECGF